MSDPCEPQAIGAQRVQIEAYLNDLLSRDAYAAALPSGGPPRFTCVISTCDYATCSMPHPRCTVGAREEFCGNVERRLDTQRETFKMQHATRNVHHATCNSLRSSKMPCTADTGWFLLWVLQGAVPYCRCCNVGSFRVRCRMLGTTVRAMKAPPESRVL